MTAIITAISGPASELNNQYQNALNILDKAGSGQSRVYPDFLFASTKAAVDAITAISSGPSILQVSTTQLGLGTTTVTIPKNLRVEFIGAGSILVTAGQTLYNYSDPSNYPRRLIFENCLPTHGLLSFDARAFTVDSTTDIFTLNAHGLSAGSAIRVSNNGGALPAPLAVATDYYVRDVTTNTFKLASTPGGAAINITTNGTGTNSIVGNASIKEIFPEWYGGGTDASPSDNSGALKRCIDTGFDTMLASGIYDCDNSSADGLTADNGSVNRVCIRGAGMKNSMLRFNSAAHACIVVDFPAAGEPSFDFRDFRIRGAAGSSPSFVAGNFGLYVPGYHGGVDHYVSDGRIKNVQIDQTGDVALAIRGNTGPVRVENPVINDVGDYCLKVMQDDNPSANSNAQDILVDGGSMQGNAKGGIGIYGGGTVPFASLTIRDVDIELHSAQTKPCLYMEHVTGANIEGITVASDNNSLSALGQSNIELGPGTYGCHFSAITNSLHGNLDAVHAQSGASGNKFTGGSFTCDAGKTGYLYSEAAAAQTLFESILKANWAGGHDSYPHLGEYYSATVRRNATVTLTNGVTANVCSITLPSGDWDLSAVVSLLNGITTATLWDIGLNTTSATLPGINSAYGDSAIENPLTSTNGWDASLVIPSAQFTISTSTTIYLVVNVAFTAGTAKAYGRLSARRLGA